MVRDLLAKYSSDSADGYGDDIDPKERARKWLDEIERAERCLEEYWKRCERIQDIFTEAKRTSSSFSPSKRRFSILWANISTLQPVVYSRTPAPVVKRRFRDRDPIARSVSELTERALEYQFDTAQFDEAMKAVRDDFLLFGRGTAWVRYEYQSEQEEPTEQEGALEVPDEVQAAEERITSESTPVDHVHYKDFIYPKARTWDEVPWVARRVYLDREQGNERFGEEVFRGVKLDHKPDGHKDKDSEYGCKATVFEIWSKADDRVCWVSRGYDGLLDEDEPHLSLRDFFPCPKPAFGTLATDSLIPTPDYVYYQDQAEEIDNLTARITELTDELRLCGFYAAGPSVEGDNPIEIAFDRRNANKLIPVPSWASFTEKGGANQIQWLPVAQVVEVVTSLFSTRAQLIQDVYQITGISDIVRGASDPRETKGAQVLKAQWGSVRIRDRQAELARFARDLTRIMAEIISDKFQGQTLLDMTGVELRADDEVATEHMQAMIAWQTQAQQAHQQFLAAAQQFAMAQQMGQVPPDAQPPQPPQPPPQPQPSDEVTIDQCLALMRDDRMRTFRIDIETDSTVEADENEHRAKMSEFMNSISGFIGTIMPAAQQYPAIAPVAGQALLAVVRAFSVGRQFEGTLEDAIAEMEEAAEQARNAPSAQPQPDPRVVEAQARAQAEQAKIEMDRARVQADLQAEQAKVALEERRFDLERMKAEFEADLRLREVAVKEAGAGIVSRPDGTASPLVTQDVLSAGLGSIQAGIAQLQADLTAPRELVRDADGQAVGVAVNGRVRPIVRDESGRPVRLN